MMIMINAIQNISAIIGEIIRIELYKCIVLVFVSISKITGFDGENIGSDFQDPPHTGSGSAFFADVNVEFAIF